MPDRFSITTGARGSITIMNAWAADPHFTERRGTPYRDEERPKLVCTLCGDSISSCATCGHVFVHADMIRSDGCVELRVKTPPPLPWWKRPFAALGMFDILIDPIPDETEWVAVANRPHRCRSCEDHS